MIKEITKKKDVPVYQPQSYKEEKYVVYECSDGKQFTNENDSNDRYKKGKQLADEYEERLRLHGIAKAELKFYSIENNKHENNGYEHSFCFYYHPNLSSETKSILFALIYELKYKEDLDKMTEGWYLVEQRVYEIDSCTRCSQYDCKGYFGLFSKFISSKEKSLNHYKEIENKIKK